MYFVAMLLTLHAVDQAPPLTVADGVHTHAALLHTLSEASPEAGKALHEMQRHKHLTLAFVQGTPRSALLRLTCMAEEGITYANLLMIGPPHTRALEAGVRRPKPALVTTPPFLL